MKNNNQDETNKIFFEINQKKQEIKDEIDKIEKYIFDLETKYLEHTQNTGNVVKGWDQCFTNKLKTNAQSIQNPLLKRQKFSSAERIFSQSSANNPYLFDNSTTASVLSNIKSSQHNGTSFLKKKKKLTLKKKKVGPIKHDASENSILKDL